MSEGNSVDYSEWVSLLDYSWKSIETGALIHSRWTQGYFEFTFHHDIEHSMAPALCATAKQLEKEMKKDTVDICVYLKMSRRLGLD